MARTGRVLAMRDVRAADVRDGGHAVASIQAAVAVVVPGDVVGDKPETRGQRAELRVAEVAGVPARDDCPGKSQTGGAAAAARSSGGIVIQALVDRDSPGGHPCPSSGLLPGRVQLPIQPPEVAQSRQALLPACTACGSDRTSPVQIDRGRKSARQDDVDVRWNTE